MSASASAYTLASLPCLGSERGPGPLGWLPCHGAAAGSAEAQRLEHGPRLQGNGLVGRHPLRTCRGPRGLCWEPSRNSGLASAPPNHLFRPELRQDYPLNLSISLSGGKETNQDSPSNGERTGKSPT